MNSYSQKLFLLSRNDLKIIAAVSMLIDHIGMIFFPSILFFRIIGRIAFPIFAFMISEGCQHTKNKKRYFMCIFILGLLCQIVFFLATKRKYFSVLFTFSFSIIVIYLLENLKNKIFENSNKTIIALILFLGSVFILYWVNTCLNIDYGFWGSILPVLTSIPDARILKRFKIIDKIDLYSLKLIFFTIGLCILSASIKGVQIYSLISVFIMMFYSKEKGRGNLKYFFYVFYPLHLAVLYLIDMFI